MSIVDSSMFSFSRSCLLHETSRDIFMMVSVSVSKVMVSRLGLSQNNYKKNNYPNCWLCVSDCSDTVLSLQVQF